MNPKLSLIMPAYNEEETIENTILSFHKRLVQENISHEILVVYDKSPDNTVLVLNQLKKRLKQLKVIENNLGKGIGYAIKKGIKEFNGDYCAIIMADLSDRPEDLIRYYNELEKGYDCAFGSRFIRGGKTIRYPIHKLMLNRLANTFIRVLFRIKYNDVTNAFKMYRKETLKGLEPILSKHFNITVELPLKSIVRGYSYSVIPNVWINRKKGESKLRIKEMGSRYLFIVLYCFLEGLLSKGDYRKK